MAYVAVKCPNCGGSIQIDDELKEGYCTYCDSLIKYQKKVDKLKVLSYTKCSLENLIELINKSIVDGKNQTQDFKVLLYRALEKDPTNQYILDLQASEIWNAEILDGTLIKYYGNVEKIILPDCIKAIDKEAFKDCYSLKEITLPKSIKRISADVFYNEDILRINAYSCSYAVRYALGTSAYLNIIDADKSYEKLLDDINYDLHKLKIAYDYKISEIEKFYNKKRRFASFSTYIIFLIQIIISIIIFSKKIDIYNVITIFVLAILFLIMVFVNKVIKNNSYANMAAHTKSFRKRCDDFLKSCGIVDFEYVKDTPYTNEGLLEESNQLRAIIEHVKKMDDDYFI